MSNSPVADLYWQVKREPKDGSLSAVIKVHAQACGLVAYIYDMHPDRVAQEVQTFLRMKV